MPIMFSKYMSHAKNHCICIKSIKKNFKWELQLDNQKWQKISKYVLLTVFNISWSPKIFLSLEIIARGIPLGKHCTNASVVQDNVVQNKIEIMYLYALVY